jgi:xanthine/uracil permease
VRVAVVGRRDQRLLDGAGQGPALQVLRGAGLVVGAGGAAAAGFALLFGVCPKFGAVVAAIPGGVLGGITVILYGMIGLVGAKIWVENGVDFGNPVNMVGLAAGIIAGIGGVTMQITDDFSLSGIALGTILVIGYFHLVNGRGSSTSGQVTQALSHPEEDAAPPPGHRSENDQE